MISMRMKLSTLLRNSKALRLRQYEQHLAFDPSKVMEYQLMLTRYFDMYGPSKSKVVVLSRKKLSHPVLAGIDQNTWDALFQIRANAAFKKDPELIRYLQKYNVHDPFKEVLTAVGYHEIGHWEFPRGSGFGCPYDKPTFYVRFIESSYEELSKTGKLSRAECKKWAERCSGAVIDHVDNANVYDFLDSKNQHYKGKILFWYLQGQQLGKFEAEYELFIRLNLAIWGDKDDSRLLEKFMGNNPDVLAAVERLRFIFTRENMRDREKWELLSREYTKEVARFLQPEQKPQGQQSAGDKNAAPQPEKKDKNQKGKGQDSKQNGQQGEDGEQGEQSQEQDQQGNGQSQGEKKQGNKSKDGQDEEGQEQQGSGSGEEQEDQDSEDGQDGSGRQGKEQDDQDGEDKKQGQGSGKGERGEEKSEDKDQQGKGSGQEESKEQDESEKGEDGSGAGQEESDEEDEGFGTGKKDESELGKDLTKKDIERIIMGRKAGQGIPFFIKTEDALDALYNGLAKRIKFKAKGKLPAAAYPIIPELRRQFNPETDDPTEADFGRLHVDPIRRRVMPSFVKTKIAVDIPIRKQAYGLPEFFVGLVDSSGSMMWGGPLSNPVGDSIIVPWGTDSYYHYALLWMWGMFRFFELEHVLHIIKISGGIFADDTLTARNLKELKHRMLNPVTGGTTLNLKKVIEMLRGKRDVVFGMASDGEIGNWSSVGNDFIRAVKPQQFFFIPIGQETVASRGMKSAGLLVKDPVTSPKDFLDMAIDLSVERFRNAINAKRIRELGKYHSLVR